MVEMMKNVNYSTRDLSLPYTTSKSKLTLTRHTEPKLETSQRVRSVKIKSTAEIEEEIMAKIPKFKARPLNKKGRLKVVWAVIVPASSGLVKGELIIVDVLGHLMVTVQTNVSSKKWSNHWAHICSLNFYLKSFSSRTAFGKFALHAMRHLKPCNLHRLSFFGGYYTSKPPPYMKKIFQCAISHGVQVIQTDLAKFSPQNVTVKL
ncbi:hypothetical protein LWI28_000777 [Acer negundo]|uniref:TPX2 central domain-containing protein n=1 Tax=Acer negundo TaxID=4023 RepID=A0AAD5NPE0_ACENE|nr:hypothetical protein LWI28_000777 [Acer negundo]